MILSTACAAVGGAIGALIAYRMARIAPAWRTTVRLLVAVAAAFVLGAVARLGVSAHSTPAGAFLTGLCGTVVSFAALARFVVRADDRRRAFAAVVIIVGSAVAAAMLGYLAFDLLGLAYVKLPRVG